MIYVSHVTPNFEQQKNIKIGEGRSNSSIDIKLERRMPSIKFSVTGEKCADFNFL